MKAQILKSALGIAAIAVLSLGLFSFESSENKNIIDQGCKHTRIQACGDKAIYGVLDLLVILLLRISQCVSNKGPAAMGVAH